MYYMRDNLYAALKMAPRLTWINRLFWYIILCVFFINLELEEVWVELERVVRLLLDLGLGPDLALGRVDPRACAHMGREIGLPGLQDRVTIQNIKGYQ